MAVLVLLLALTPHLPAAAVETPEPDAALRDAPRSAAIAAAREATRAELERIGSQVSLTRETSERLEGEIAAIGEDLAAVREAMITAAAAQQETAVEISRVETQMSALTLRENDLRASLHERRGTLAEVLAALQRMGRAPPPAILVRPNDALGSVRSAILLGAVVPSMREETEALMADLTELASLKGEIEEQKTRFAASLARQREEETRLLRLSKEKERLEADSRLALAQANRRTAELAGEAATLEDLILTLERDLAQAQAAEEEAHRMAEAERLRQLEERSRQAAEAMRGLEEGTRLSNTGLPPADGEDETRAAAREEPAGPAGETYDVASLRREMARLDVSAPFSTLKGILSTPVAGEARRAFGEDDGFGRRTTGMVFAARAGDLVTAPADGHVLYSGPFRSYGQLLILNAGDGYHIVLAGMREIDVDAGQFVLAGEPVGIMGARRLASAGAADMPSTEPSLYVEFRKDGKPVDPAPWWAEGPSGRTRNDS
ncbi:murein hydrolase activator EnvC family protein [Aureimonas populi]|uniref:Murein hydrolase activator EnvC family protein n=1 Tax=Aureimonas populi TaxID=1701758 RepID=A0ABW5CMS4_9HYPH|nr:peptidoglycan DD-metalloendopeptidase family protein [Aureimonas populi]